SKLHKKYVTWALGASLAMGGIGVPMKVMYDSKGSIAHPERGNDSTAGLAEGISGDLKTAQNIATQVAGGVAAVAKGVEMGVEQAAKAPLDVVSSAPGTVAAGGGQIAKAADGAKERFFASEVPFGSIIYKEAKKNNLRPELVAAMI